MGELNLPCQGSTHHMTISCFQWATQPHKAPHLCGGGGPLFTFFRKPQTVPLELGMDMLNLWTCIYSVTAQILLVVRAQREGLPEMLRVIPCLDPREMSPSEYLFSGSFSMVPSCFKNHMTALSKSKCEPCMNRKHASLLSIGSIYSSKPKTGTTCSSSPVSFPLMLKDVVYSNA